jgi:hypothetical protein
MWPSNIPDAEIDRLLAGHQPEDSRLDDVAQFLSDLDSSCSEESTAALEATHVSAMIEAAHLLAENPPAALPLGSALAARGKRHPAFALKSLAAHKWATAAVLSAVGMLAFGGAAYAGVLPEQIQDTTSVVVERVGIKIPKAHRIKQAGNNGVRDHGAGVGNGKGRGGINRSPNSQGAAKLASGTVDAEKAKTAAIGGATGAAAKARARRAAAAGSAAKASAKSHKRAVVKKKAKPKVKSSTSGSNGKKPSAADVDRETGKGN